MGIHAVFDGHEAELNVLSASYNADAERSILFADLDDMGIFEEKMQADKERFTLHDEGLCRYDDLLFETDEYTEAFKDYAA